MRHQTDMLKGVIWKELLFFFIPILGGTIFQQLYNTVDAMVVGNVVGKQALAAVGGSTGTFLMLLIGFVIGISSGATVVVAQYYGNRDEEKAQLAVKSGMWLAIVLGAVLCVAGFVFAPTLLHILNVPEDIFSYSLTYLRLYLIGMIPTLIYNTGAGVLRAVGDSRRPLYFLVVSCITNIVLDLLLVVVFPFGIAGAAVATTLSQVVSCVLTLQVLENATECYRYTLKDFGYDPTILKQIVKIGFPTGIQSSLYGVANLFVQAGINTAGTNSVAAFTAFGKIDSLFWNASGAFGQSVMTFAGQNFGAGNVDRVKQGFHTGVWMHLIGSLFISLICWLGGPYLYRLFTPDEEVIAIGLQMLHQMAPFWATFCFVEILSSGIRACGDSLMPTILTAFGIGALRILYLLFYPCTSIHETLRCYPVSWILTSILFLGYYLQGGWLKRSLAKREEIMRAGS